jgi:hypothetical protein
MILVKKEELLLGVTEFCGEVMELLFKPMDATRCWLQITSL